MVTIGYGDFGGGGGEGVPMGKSLLLPSTKDAVLQGNMASYCPPIDQSDCNMTSSHIMKMVI